MTYLEIKDNSTLVSLGNWTQRLKLRISLANPSKKWTLCKMQKWEIHFRHCVDWMKSGYGRIKNMMINPKGHFF